MISVPLSALDLALVQDGTSAAEALAATVTMAKHLEQQQYHRLWVAEHHSGAAIASSSPPVIVGQLAAATSTLRVGSGGVMLPNHTPLAVAEQFATLDAFHPGRIDLGVGRGPGALDPTTVLALRRGGPPATDQEYQQDIHTLLGLFGGEQHEPALAPPLPGYQSSLELWLLSSSAAGARLAAEFGLPLAFAHHFRPDNTEAAVTAYHESFRPSRWLAQPQLLLCVHTICADSDEQANWLAGPSEVATANLAEGRAVPFLTPEDAAGYAFSDTQRQTVQGLRYTQAQGSPDTVSQQLAALVDRTGAHELMLSTPVYALSDRLRSFELVASKATQS